MVIDLLVIILASVVLEVVMSGYGYKNKSWLLTFLERTTLEEFLWNNGKVGCIIWYVHLHTLNG